MDQSKSSSSGVKEAGAANGAEIPMPKRTFTVELIVGIFTILGCIAAAYLAIGLGGLQLSTGNTYDVYAEFDNVSGLNYGATVEIGGVPIGQVVEITLKDPMALVRLRINNDVALRDDDILSIRTKGIIGDRYVKVSRGGAGDDIKPGGVIFDTESVVDIEDLIGKFIHSLDSGEAAEDGDAPESGAGIFPESEPRIIEERSR